MSLEWVRQHCLAMPHVTEHIPWAEHLVYKVGGKMFASSALSPEGLRMTFKCTPEEFAELTERPGVVPAPYCARMFWVALETGNALPRAEVKQLLTQAYQLVFAKLPKKTQAELSSNPVKKRK
ncbi:MAG TPA: MmcQ/YjbR family DNA-binding protein [Bryobacteraceae bacterium]|jgi:predicted DNA-binding protein (MmcQ/YjbR family)